MKSASYHSFFRNFSNRIRLNIILSLSRRPLSVTEIVKAVGEEQSKVSHHLIGLAKCGILNVKRRGKQRIYSLNRKSVNPLLRAAERHIQNCEGRCCKNENGCLFG
ncbi:MAG: metalloregulator ArsR/SmtB family transcription factor [Candidatus Bilamarchaeaceae archaeon]